MPATAMNTVQKTAQLRVERALAKPGATGMKGMLLWTEAAFPKAIAHEVLKAASRYTPGATPTGRTATLSSPPAGGFGFLGDDSGLQLATVSLDIPDISSSTTQAISDATQAPVSPVTAATPSQPPSDSWVSDVSKAFTAAATAGLGVVQALDAQKIFNTNLSLAQQGKSLIPFNPTQYGLPAPTANIGLTPTAQNTLLMLGGLVVAGVVVASLGKSRRGRA